jgi:hypothetical protein
MRLRVCAANHCWFFSRRHESEEPFDRRQFPETSDRTEEVYQLMGSRRVALMLGLVFACFVQLAQAGVIRSAGQEIAAGADSATQVAAAGGAAVAGGTVSAGHAAVNVFQSGLNKTESGAAAATGKMAATGASAGGAVADGASDAAQGVERVSSNVLDQGQAGFRKLWHAIW